MERPNPYDMIFKTYTDMEMVVGERQRVFYEILEITPRVGATKMRLIAYGPDDDRVTEQFVKWQKDHPRGKFGTHRTGPITQEEIEQLEAVKSVIRRLDVLEKGLERN